MISKELIKKEYFDILDQFQSDLYSIRDIHRKYVEENYIFYVGQINDFKVGSSYLDTLAIIYTLFDLSVYIQVNFAYQDVFEQKIVQILMGDYTYTSFLLKLSVFDAHVQSVIHSDFSNIFGYCLKKSMEDSFKCIDIRKDMVESLKKVLKVIG